MNRTSSSVVLTVLLSTVAAAACTSRAADDAVSAASNETEAKPWTDFDACTGTPMSVAQARALLGESSSFELGRTSTWRRETNRGDGYPVNTAVLRLERTRDGGTALNVYIAQADGQVQVEAAPKASYPLPVNADNFYPGLNERIKTLLTAKCFQALDTSFSSWANGQLLNLTVSVPDDPECKPATCEEASAPDAKSCGTIQDGCGGTISCGGCGEREYCDSHNHCHPQFCCGPYTYPARNTSGTYGCFSSDFYPTGACVNDG